MPVYKDNHCNRIAGRVGKTYGKGKATEGGAAEGGAAPKAKAAAPKAKAAAPKAKAAKAAKHPPGEPYLDSKGRLTINRAPKAKAAKAASPAKGDPPKFLGHTGASGATGADRWWQANEDKPKWRKKYEKLVEDSFEKQGVQKKPNGDYPISASMVAGRITPEFAIAQKYADAILRKYWEENIKK